MNIKQDMKIDLKMVLCQGTTKSGEPCKRDALSNGYCKDHQYFAIQDLIRLLDQLKQKWNTIRTNEMKNGTKSRSTRNDPLRLDITKCQQELKQALNWCQSDSNCYPRLELLMSRITKLMNPLPNPDITTEDSDMPELSLKQRTALIPLFSELQSLSVPGIINKPNTDQLVGTDQLVREMNLTQDRKTLNDDQINKVQQMISLNQNAYNHADQELKNEKHLIVRKFQDMSGRLAEEQVKAQHYQHEMNTVHENYSRLHGEQLNTVQKMKDELELRQNEILLEQKKIQDQNAKIAALEEKVKQTDNEVLRWKREFEIQKQSGVSHVETHVLAHEEKTFEYEKELERLKKELSEAVRLQQLTLESAKHTEENQALSMLPEHTMVGRYTSLRADYDKVVLEANELRKKHGEQLKVIDSLQTNTAINFEKATRQQITQIKTCEERKLVLEEEMTTKHKQLLKLSQELAHSKQQFENMIHRLQIRIKQLEADHKLVYNESETLRSELKDKISAHQVMRDQYEKNLKTRELVMRDNINTSWNAKMSELKDQQRQLKDRIEHESKTLQLSNHQLNERKEILNQQRRRFEIEEQQLQNRIAEYSKHKTKLNFEMQRIHEQSKHYTDMKHDYDRTIKLWQGKYDNLQHRFTTQNSKLQDDLRHALENKSFIEQSFQKCQMKQQTLLNDMSLQRDESSKWRMKYDQLNMKLKVMEREYDIYKTQIHAKNAALEMTSQKCALKLNQASTAHQHSIQIEEETKKLRRELQQNINAAQAQSMSIKKLLSSRSVMENQQMVLQTKLQETELNEKSMKVNLDSMTKDLMQLKTLVTQLNQDRQLMKEELDRLYMERKADQERNKLRENMSDAMWKQRITSIQSKDAENEQLLNQWQKKLKVAQEALVESENGRHDQVNNLLGYANSTSQNSNHHSFTPHTSAVAKSTLAVID